MATFFDVDDQADRNLLNSRIRNHADMSTVVDTAERDILLRFTIRTGVNTYRVELEGYNDSTPASSNALLIETLRRAVAVVSSWRLLHIDEDPTLLREKLSEYEYERGAALDKDFPEGWDAELKEFYAETERWVHV